MLHHGEREAMSEVNYKLQTNQQKKIKNYFGNLLARDQSDGFERERGEEEEEK